MLSLVLHWLRLYVRMRCCAYTAVRVRVEKRPAGHWVEAGWVRDAAPGLMPTLTRALPGDKPPKCPVGLSRADAETKARWRSDKHRYQVYQYSRQYLLRSVKGNSLRVPTANDCSASVASVIGLHRSEASAFRVPAHTFNPCSLNTRT